MGDSEWLIVTKTSVLTDFQQSPQHLLSGVVIDCQENNHIIEDITYLRQQPHLALMPLFYLGELPVAAFAALFDGAFDEKAKSIAESILQRMLEIPYTKYDWIHEPELLLLSYLYVRPDFQLTCHLDYHLPQSFRYYLLEVLWAKESPGARWALLQRMLEQEWLIALKRAHVLQVCPLCESGLLNLHYCCPNCHGTAIQQEPLLHCFSCGHVAVTALFSQEDKLQCPACHTILRRIGIDYDAPIEDKLCLDCKQYSHELVTKIWCLVCLKSLEIDQLESRVLSVLTLGVNGKRRAQSLEQKLYGDLDKLFCFLPLPTFIEFLNWQTRLHHRYKYLFFSLVGLKIINEAELVQLYGSVVTEKMIMDFFIDVRQVFRESDLVARDKACLLFFLPMTPLKSCRAIIKKIQAVQKQQSKIHVIDLALSHLSSESIENLPNKALILIDTLYADMQTSRT